MSYRAAFMSSSHVDIHSPYRSRLTTTVPGTPIIGAETVESGTVSDGTGALAGFEGAIENRFHFHFDEGQTVGTYTVTAGRTG
jgi:hypothetical protein